MFSCVPVFVDADERMKKEFPGDCLIHPSQNFRLNLHCVDNLLYSLSVFLL